MDKSTTHPCHTLSPTVGPELTVTGGFLHGKPVAAMFVGNSSEPIVLDADGAGELALLLWMHTGGEHDPR